MGVARKWAFAGYIVVVGENESSHNPHHHPLLMVCVEASMLAVAWMLCVAYSQMMKFLTNE